MIKYTWLSLLLSVNAVAGYNFDTKKVSHVTGVIDPESAETYFQETTATLDLPGDRVIYIDSLGGRLDAGQNIIDMMGAERAHGVKLVCVWCGTKPLLWLLTFSPTATSATPIVRLGSWSIRLPWESGTRTYAQLPRTLDVKRTNLTGPTIGIGEPTPKQCI